MSDADAGKSCPVDLDATYDPFSEPQLTNPYPVWEQARDQCPVFYSEKLGAWVVSRYADISEVLSNHEVYSSVGASRGFSDLSPEAAEVLKTVPSPAETDIVPTDPPRHTKMRRFIQLSFLPKRIASLEPKITSFGNELIDAMEPRGKCDFYRDFAYPYPLSVVTSLVGIPRKDMPQIKRWVESNVALKWGRLGPSEQLAAANARKAYFEYLFNFVAERRSKNEDDFVAALVTHSEGSDDPLTEIEMVGQISSLITAGHETTANFLTLTLDAFLRDRQLWESLVSNPASIPSAIEESLRLNAPVQSLWRTTTRDRSVAGVQVPAGSRLTAVIGSANRDESVFHDASVFNVDRPEARMHMAFGRGIHSCAGSNLAKMEIRIALELLTKRLPNVRRDHEGPMQFAPSALQRAPRQLRLAWD
jgi:cytochrome P450